MPREDGTGPDGPANGKVGAEDAAVRVKAVAAVADRARAAVAYRAVAQDVGAVKIVQSRLNPNKEGNIMPGLDRSGWGLAP